MGSEHPIVSSLAGGRTQQRASITLGDLALSLPVVSIDMLDAIDWLAEAFGKEGYYLECAGDIARCSRAVWPLIPRSTFNSASTRLTASSGIGEIVAAFLPRRAFAAMPSTGRDSFEPRDSV